MTGRSFLGIVCMHSILWACAMARGEAATSRPAVPDAAARSRAAKLVREVYQREYAAKDIAQRQALARKLIEQADQSGDDPAARYVLLCEARDIAASAADANGAADAVRKLAESFDVQGPAMLLTAMEGAIRAATAPADCVSAAGACLKAVDRAVAEEDFGSARKLLNLAQAAAQRAKSPALFRKTQDRISEMRMLAAVHQRSVLARQTLAKNEDDPAANFGVGSYLCFVKGDWDSGLPMLARSGDAELSKLAAADLARPIDASKGMELGDAWWALAEKRSGLMHRNIANRAAFWYRQAVSGLEGLNRATAAKRIDEADRAVLAAMNLEPGLLAQLYRGANFDQRVRSRIDPGIDFDWGMESADESLPKDNFSIRWKGKLRITSAGKCDLTIIANGGAKLWIDGKLVLDASGASRSRNGISAAVELAEGLHDIRVDFWDSTGLARMRLLWQPPEASAKEAIPASAFLHDVGIEQ